MPDFTLDRNEIDLDLCLNSGQVFRWQREGDTYTGVDGSNWYRVEGDRVTTNATKEELNRLLNLNTPLPEAHKQVLARGPELENYIAALPGLRMLQPSDPVETLFSFLCTANNLLARIGPMVRKLAEYGDDLVTLDSVRLTTFPSVERVASIPEGELRIKGFGYRGRSIPIAAQQLLERGDGWLESLKGSGFQAARSELMSIHSIGPKLADCICLYGLHYTEATPFDTHLWQAVTRQYFPDWMGLPLTKSRYEGASEFLRNRFGDLAGYAHLLLYLENLKNWRKR